MLLLWAEAMEKGYIQHSWMTFNQAKALGANVKKGERATEIIFYRTLTVTEKVKNISTGNEEDMEVVVPMIKTFNVFNTAQIENLPERVCGCA